ncbi:MAG: hypothetical protein KDA36_06800 [Planctomycetaceae bacterium]|nr:hypothetical protein [Planctomycetaceae bacterium]
MNDQSRELTKALTAGIQLKTLNRSGTVTMLRYFVASQAWLFFAVLIVLGRGSARVNPTFYNVFSIGFLSPFQYWFVVVVCCLVSLGCSIKHHHTLRLPN